MKTIQEEIQKYIHLFMKYPASGEATEKYMNYQLALADLCQLVERYYPASQNEAARVLTDADITALREGYRKAMAAGKDFQKFVAESGELDNPNARARNELINNMDTLLGNDYNAFSNVLGAEGKTLPEVIEQSRGYQVDITGQNISKSGANMSNRIPVSFEDKNGRKVTGFFTENTVTNQNGELQELYDKAIKDHPEFERAFRGLMGDQYFRGCFSDVSGASTYLQQAMEKEDLNHAFDDYLWQLLPNRPKEQKEQIKKDEEELEAYINSITKDNTFAKRMVDFCKGYAGITNKYGLLKRVARIEDGSNIDERNAAMSSVGDLLGVPHLLARSVKMELIDNGEHKKGVFMEFASGSDLAHQKENDPMGRVTQEGLDNPDAFKSIADLQVLDYVCGNIDRHSGNMFYQFSETENGPKLTGVVGIDNDCSFGKVEGTRYNDAQNMVGTNSMLTISEGMAHKIASMTPEMLEMALKNYALSPEEVQMAWERVKSVKAAIDEGVEFYEKNPDVSVQKGHLRIVKDEEWKNLSLRELAMPASTKVGEEEENAYGNYFSKIYFLPQMAATTVKEKEEKRKAQEALWEKHPELKGEELPFTIAQGTKLTEVNAAGIAENNRQLDILQGEMKNVNRGLFVGSSQFKDMMTAFGQVKELSGRATPEMSAKEIKALHDAYQKLDKMSQIYIDKKAKEAKKKDPSDVAKARMVFAKELQKFVKERVDGLANEYVDLQKINNDCFDTMCNKTAPARMVTDAVTTMLTCCTLQEYKGVCKPEEYQKALTNIQKAPGFREFVAGSAKLQEGFTVDADFRKKMELEQKMLSDFYEHTKSVNKKTQIEQKAEPQPKPQEEAAVQEKKEKNNSQQLNI